MTEVKPKMNIYEKMTANEEVYYSFLKNLQYVFSELERIEDDYADSLDRLLYFMNINNEDNNKFPALDLRRHVISHLEKARDIHYELSKSCSSRLYNPIKDLLAEDLRSKIEFEQEREKNEKFYSELKENYEGGKKTYYSQAEETAKAYRDDIKKKFKPSMVAKEFEEYRKKNAPLRKETIRLQEEWEKNISLISQKRFVYINKKKEQIQKYKEKNKGSLLKLNNILDDYFNIYRDFYAKSSELLETSKMAFGKKVSPLEKYDTMFDDVSDWGEPPKFDFVPFISANDQFFNKELLPDKKKYTIDFLNHIRAYLGEFCGYKAPELFDADPERRGNFEKIQTLSDCVINGNPENISKESMDLMYTKKEYILFYLRSLNKNRSKLISIPENVYKLIKDTMWKFLDLCNNPDYKNGEIEQYFEILEFVIILSQTFYLSNPNQTSKMLLQDEISQHPIWKNTNIWLDIINYHVETEKVKQKVAEEKKLNERECKIKTIALSTIITFVFNMSSFNLDQTVVDALKVKCAEKYKINIKDIPDLGTEQRTESFVSNAEPRDSTASVPGKSG